MSTEMQLVVYPTRELDDTKKLFSALLGVDPYIDGQHYVGFRSDGLEVGLDPNGKDGPICYWGVDDIDLSVTALVEAGATLDQDAQDVGGGMLVAKVKDPNGNLIGLRQSS